MARRLFTSESVTEGHPDKNLLPILAKTLAEYDNVTVVNEDILKVDIAALTGGST